MSFLVSETVVVTVDIMLRLALCPGIFFSLPTQEFFRGQGKIKVGTETKKHSHFLTYSKEEMGAQNIMVNCLFLYK